MLICKILFFLFSIGLLVTSFSAFNLSPSLRKWIERALTSTSLGLSELASFSTQEALVVFSRYFGGAGAFVLIISALFSAQIDGQSKELLNLLAFALIYSAASINAWNQRRAEILAQFISEAKRDTLRYTKYFSMFSLLLLLVTASVSTLLGEMLLNFFGPLVLFLVAAVLTFAVAIIMGNTVSLLIVFGPALVAVSYLWLTIYVARGALAVGRRRLVNLLVLYTVFATLYFTALGFPELRESLHLPVLCR